MYNAVKSANGVGYFIMSKRVDSNLPDNVLLYIVQPIHNVPIHIVLPSHIVQVSVLLYNVLIDIVCSPYKSVHIVQLLYCRSDENVL